MSEINTVHVATRNLTLHGRDYRAGEPVDLSGVSRHRLKQLVTGRKLTVVKATEKLAAATDAEDATPVAVLVEIVAEAVSVTDEGIGEAVPTAPTPRRKRKA